MLLDSKLMHRFLHYAGLELLNHENKLSVYPIIDNFNCTSELSLFSLAKTHNNAARLSAGSSACLQPAYTRQ